MSIVRFLSAGDHASGVASPDPVGDVINTPMRDIIAALGGSPGSGATYEWSPRLRGGVRNLALDYGVKFDNTTDNLSAIQAAFDDADAGSISDGLATITADAGVALTSKPIWLKAAGFVLDGLGQNVNSARGSEIRGTYYAGPTLLCANSSASFGGLVAALTAGTGSAWQLSGNTRWVNLRDSPTLDLDGLTAFGVECFYQAISSGDTYTIVASQGKRLSSDTLTSAFALLNALGTVSFKINISGTVKTVTGGSIADGAVHFLEGNWDGTTVRLFVDGVLVASTAASGTISQNAAEDVLIGPAMLLSPERQILAPDANGTIDSLRISNLARRTSSYTAPTTKFANDGNTLALLTFDLQLGPMTRAQSKNGDIWLVQRRLDLATGRSGTIRGMSFSGSGSRFAVFLGSATYNWNATRLQIRNSRYGIYGPQGNMYGYRLSESYINLNGGRCGVLLSANGGIGHIDTVWTQGCQVHYSLGAATHLTNTFMQSDNFAIAPLQLTGPYAYTLRGSTVNTEEGSSSAFRGSVLLDISVPGIVDWVGGAIETGNDAPCIIADGTSIDGVEFRRVSFSGSGSSPSIMQARGTFNTPICFRGCPQTHTWKNWSDVPDTATAEVPGRRTVVFQPAPTFDFSLASQWTLGQLTDNVTAQIWQNAGDGQPIVVRYQQNASVAKTVAAPSNVIGWTAISATLGSISEFRGSYDQGLGKFVGSMFAGLT